MVEENERNKVEVSLSNLKPNWVWNVREKKLWGIKCERNIRFLR